MTDPEKIFREYCREHGMRFTPERALIIREICGVKGHFDVDKLFLRLREKHPDLRIAKGSIYRSIPHFVASGLIRESLAEDNRKYYETALGNEHHDHLKCIGCGMVFEFSEKEIDKAREKLLDKLGFRMMNHMHVINGYCKKCRKKVPESRSYRTV